MHWQTNYPDKASWQANLLSGLVLMGFLALGFGLDFKIYDARSHITGNEPGARGYVIDRWGLHSLNNRNTPRVFPSRDYVETPLTLRERAKRARYLSAALPMAPEGWVLRPIELDDVVLLRPEWADCELRKNMVRIGHTPDPERKHCPDGITWYDTWVYEKGDVRVAVWLRYFRSRDAMPFFCMPVVSQTLLTQHSFPRGRAGAGSSVMMQRDGWSIRVLPTRARGPDGVSRQMPLRAYTEKQGDAHVQVYAMTNGSRGVLNTILTGVDFALLDAMVAPPV